MADKLVRLLLKSVGEAEVRRSLEEIGTSGRRMGDGVERGAKKGTAALKVLDRAGTDVRGRLRGLAGPLGALTEATGTTGLALGALGATAVGLGVFFGKAAQAAIPFEHALSELSAITGATGQQLEYLKQTALDLAPAARVSGTEVLDAFRGIASAKPELLSSSAALAEVTKAAITLSQATGLDIPAAGRVLTTALNQFRAPAEEASRYINVLAAGAQLGSAEIPDLTIALVKAGSVAKQSGLSFESFNATLQKLASLGTPTEEIGVALRNILLELAKRGEDATVRTRGIVAAMRELGLTTADTARIADIFGKRNATVAIQLLQLGDAVQTLETRITGTNTAFEQAQTRTNNLKGDLDRLRAQWNALEVTVGESEGGFLRVIAQAATAATARVTDLIGAIGRLGVINVTDTVEGIAKLTEQLQAARARGDEAQAQELKGRIRELRQELFDLRDSFLREQARIKDAAERGGPEGGDKDKTLPTGTDPRIAQEKRFLAEIQQLRDQTETRNVDAIRKVEIERDRALAHAEDLLKQHVIDEREAADAREAINADAESKILKIRTDAADKAAKEQQRAQEKAAEQQKRDLQRRQEEQARILAAPFEQAFADIQRLGADAFFQVFRGAKGDAIDFAATLKDLMARTAAEIAQLLIFQAVIRPALVGTSGGGGLLGALGLLGGQQGAQGGQNGGGSVLGSVLSGLGLVSKVSGAVGGPTAGTLVGGLGGSHGIIGGLFGPGVSTSLASTFGVQGGSGGLLGLLFGSGAGTIIPVSGGSIVLGAGGSAVFTAVPAGFVGPLTAAGTVSAAGAGGAAGAAAGGAAAGASIGAIAGAATLGAALAAFNSYVLSQSFQRGKLPTTMGSQLAFGATPGLISGPLILSNTSNTRAGVWALTDPFGAVGQNILGIGPVGDLGVSRQELILRDFIDSLNSIFRRDFFRFGDVGGARAGLRAAGRAQLDELQQGGFDVVLRLLAGAGARGLDLRGRRGDIRDIFEGGIARAGAAGKDLETVLERMVRRFLNVRTVINQLNHVLLNGKVSLEDFTAGAGIVFEAFRFARQGTGQAVAQAVVDRRGFLSPADIQFEAQQAARQQAIDTGAVDFGADLQPGEERRLRRTRRRRNQARREARDAINAGAFDVLETIRKVEEGLAELQDPAKVLPDRLGDLQVAIDGVTGAAGNVKSLQDFEQLVGNAIDAAKAWGEAIAAQADAANQARLAVIQTKQAIGVEVAGLRDQNTAPFFQATADAARRDFFSQRTNAGRIAALQADIEAERNAFAAQVADLTRAFDKLTPLAGIVGSLQGQIAQIRLAQTGGGVPTILELERQLAAARQEFRTAAPEDQATAAGKVQTLVDQLLGAAEGTLGSGSARLAALRELGLSSLGEILTKAESATDIQRDIRDEIQGLRSDWADRLESLGDILVGLQGDQATAYKDALRNATGPDGKPLFPDEASLEAAIRDPFFRQIFVAEQTKAVLDNLDGTVTDILKELQTGGLTGSPDQGRPVPPPDTGTADVGPGGGGIDIGGRFNAGTAVSGLGLSTTSTAPAASLVSPPTVQQPPAPAPIVIGPIEIRLEVPPDVSPTAAARFGRTAADAFEARVLEINRRRFGLRPGVAVS